MLQGAGVVPHALRMNGAGEPAHPLYLPGNLKPKKIHAIVRGA
jgi:hypothetical protein